MNNAVQNLVKPIVDASMNIVNNTVEATRQAAVNSAKLVAKSKAPVQIMTESSLKLNAISHKSMARLLSVQSHAVEGTLLATAKRLETAANANSVNELVNDQMALIPKTRDRLAGDARNTLDVLVDTRDELRELVTATVADFGRGTPTVAAKTRRTAKKKATTAKRTAKKATGKARKTATRAKTSAKKTAKKVTRKG